MKTKCFSFILLLFVCSSFVSAQMPELSSKSGLSAASPAKLLSQFTGAIKPTSFIDETGEQKNSLLGKAQKLTNAANLATNIASIAGLIKPSLFKEGSSAANIMKTANQVKNMGQAANLLKGLEGGLKPEAFVSGWSDQKPSWMSMLNMIK